MPVETHELMDGALHVYRREGSRYWQCATYLGSRNHRQTTKETSLAAAKDFARDWYMERCVEDRQRRRGGVSLLDVPVQHLIAGPGAPTDGRRRRTPTGPSFEDAAKAFTSEFEVITLGERNAGYVASKSDIIRVHLLPFFGNTALADITAGKVQEYRAHRQTSRLDPKTGKLEHRAWFLPEEYKILYEATRERAKNPPKPRWREVCETFHDYVLFMGNTGLRPDESSRLELRDVKIMKDESTGERILEIEVRGKRGVGFCKSMSGAILPFERVRKRKNLKPTDKIFGKSPRELMNTVLDELNLKFDRDGHIRTCYSLRHTYICLRLLEGADIYQVAKNCRTSVEMIEKFYGRHLQNNIDASAVNVRKARPRPVAARNRVAKSKQC